MLGLFACVLITRIYAFSISIHSFPSLSLSISRMLFRLDVCARTTKCVCNDLVSLSIATKIGVVYVMLLDLVTAASTAAAAIAYIVRLG